MIKTALDKFTPPPSATLLGWRMLDARPSEGWLKVGFDGRAEFCNPAGYVQGGILSAMLDDTMGPAALIMTDGKFYTTTISLTVNFLKAAKPGPHRGSAGHPTWQDHRLHGRKVDGRGWHTARDRDHERAPA
jgi:uncharacterized protein (TIGR00369 family)